MHVGITRSRLVWGNISLELALIILGTVSILACVTSSMRVNSHIRIRVHKLTNIDNIAIGWAYGL